LRSGLTRSARHLVTDEAPPASVAPRDAGAALFRALFSGQPGTLLAHSLGSTGERGLRLRLRFQLDPDDPRLTLLHSLPWELLYKADSRDFLGLSRRTPIIRSLEIPRPAPALPLPSPLRILAIPALPEDTARLDLDLERRNLQEAWKEHPDVEIVPLEKPGLAGLRQTLLASPFHVLHFMGHGEVDPTTGRGILFFAGTDGSRSPVSGEALAEVLKDIRTLRLVFLNACESGRTPDGSEVDPFAGVATALVLGGVPAVVAMQLPVSDAAAIHFSQTFYQRLAAGDTLDAAVAEGRLALFTEFPDTVEWAVPVLFSRIADGCLFKRRVRIAWPRLHIPRRARPWLLGAAALSAAAWLIWVSAPFLRRQLPGAAVPPIEKVRVDNFEIARYEVTNEQFLRFVKARPEWQKGNVPPQYQDGDYLKDWPSRTEYPAAEADYPVTQVSWFAAHAFCEWAEGRLPTLEEWKQAAHAADGRFPWGKTDFSGSAPLNFCDADCELQHRSASLPTFRDGYAETAPVTAFPMGRSPEGVYNLSGNVWEWCLTPSGRERVTMGGSYASQFDECSTDIPEPFDATTCARDGGFRCAWD
jgi:formylglycine-generating enzyme required for sulfatase activity